MPLDRNSLVWLDGHFGLDVRVRVVVLDLKVLDAERSVVLFLIARELERGG